MKNDVMKKKESLDYRFGKYFWNAVVCVLCVALIAAFCIALKIEDTGLILILIFPFLFGVGYNGSSMYQTNRQIEKLD